MAALAAEPTAICAERKAPSSMPSLPKLSSASTLATGPSPLTSAANSTAAHSVQAGPGASVHQTPSAPSAIPSRRAIRSEPAWSLAFPETSLAGTESSRAAVSASAAEAGDMPQASTAKVGRNATVPYWDAAATLATSSGGRSRRRSAERTPGSAPPAGAFGSPASAQAIPAAAASAATSRYDSRQPCASASAASSVSGY
jgi:hypothetical protein